MSKPIKLKITLSSSIADQDKEEALSGLVQYVDTVLTKHEGLPTHFYQESSNDSIIIESDRTGIYLCIERLLEEYASLGLNCDIDLYAIIVYCSDPELNTLLLSDRMNITAASQESMFESLMEEGNSLTRDMNHVAKKVAGIDAVLTLKGMYAFRDVITIIAEALESKDIHVLDDINGCFKETIH